MRNYALGLFVLLAACVSAQEGEKVVDDARISQALETALQKSEGVKTVDALLKEDVPPKGGGIEPASGGKDILGPEGALRALRPSTLIVGIASPCGRCRRSHARTASAFAIAKDVVVTNFHVLKDGGGVGVVMDIRGKTYPFEKILAKDPLHDLAILRVRGGAFSPLPLADDLPPSGSEIYLLSHPSRNYWVFTRGVVSRTAKRGNGGVPVVNITAPYAQGSSGAPVVDSRGRVVAVVKSTRALFSSAKRHGHGGAHPQGYVQMILRETVPAKRIRELLR